MPKEFVRQPGGQASTPVMSARCERFGGVTVVHLAGDLDMETADRAGQVLDDAVSATTTALVLDLNGITFFGSSGLNLLVRLKESLCGQGKNLHVVAANRRVLLPLQITELDAAFEIHPTVDQALTAAQRPGS